MSAAKPSRGDLIQAQLDAAIERIERLETLVRLMGTRTLAADLKIEEHEQRIHNVEMDTLP